MVALAVTRGLVELVALVPKVVLGAAAAADSEFCSVVELTLPLCIAPSVCTIVDVEVDFTVT